MRVCHILPTVFCEDGPSNVLFELVAALRARGISNSVISMRPAPSERDPERVLRDLGARYINLQMKESLWNPAGLLRLAVAIRAQEAEIVQCNLFRANVYGTLAAQISKNSHVVCVAHNIERYMVGGDRFSRAARLLERQTARLASAYVAVSEAVASAVCQTLSVRRKLAVIPNGLSDIRVPLERTAARRILGLCGTSFVVGSVGRLHPQKGYANLLNVAASLRDVIPQLQVVIIGDGPEREQLERLASSKSLQGVAHIVGSRRDVTDVLSAFDLFVMTSHYEGLPVALLEAMRCAIPCVVTNAGGMPEVVVEGKTGFVVEQGDVATLAARIRVFEQNRALIQEMGAAAQERFRARYTSQVMAGRYEALYNAILLGKWKPNDCAQPA